MRQVHPVLTQTCETLDGLKVQTPGGLGSSRVGTLAPTALADTARIVTQSLFLRSQTLSHDALLLRVRVHFFARTQL